MSELDDFVRRTVQRHSEATTGVRIGDATAFIDQLSTRDPVTLFPASQADQMGWSDVSRAIRSVASVYSGSNVVEFEVVAAEVSGDLAYLVGYEWAASSIAGSADESLGLRITQVYRREDDEWKLAHRHADPRPDSGAGDDHLRHAMRNRRGD